MESAPATEYKRERDNKNPKRKYTVCLDGLTISRLKKLSKKTHVPVSAYIRMGIKSVLDREERKGRR